MSPVKSVRRSHVLIDDLPYICMTILGAKIFIIGLLSSTTKWLSAGAYVLCGIAGAFWIMIFVCPHCHLYPKNMDALIALKGIPILG